MGHELLWRIPPLSLGMRLLVLLGLERWAWAAFEAFGPRGDFPEDWRDVSPALSAIEVAALAAAFGVAALVHARRRSSALA